MTGVVQDVKKFKHKSYGFIFGSDSKVYYFNFNDCLDGRDCENGDSVSFDVLGEKAINVQVNK